MAPWFLRLISWKTRPQSIQIFVKLDFFTNFLVVSFVLIYSVTLRSWAESAVSPAEKKCYFGFDIGKKCEFQIEWGWVFHDVNLKNNGAIVFSWFSTIYGWVSKSFSDMRETFTVVGTYTSDCKKFRCCSKLNFAPLSCGPCTYYTATLVS